MNIIVLLKQVPSPDAVIEIEESKKKVRRTTQQLQVNETDDYALETALRLKEKHGGQVTVLTLGPMYSREILFMAMAKGADQAIHFPDEEILNSDSYLTAKLLSEVVKILPQYDLILTGVESTDCMASQVGIVIAEALGIPHVSVVTGIDEASDTHILKVRKDIGDGFTENLEVPLPALLTIQYGIYSLRYAPLLKVAEARRKKIKTVKLADLPPQAQHTSTKARLVEMSYPSKRRKTAFLEGSPMEIAKILTDKLRNEAKVI
jgi:electron transfer flavoprotein beta subunit